MSAEPVFFATPAELRTWFEANHATEAELQVGFYKKASGRPSITWSEAVDEALCVGWIDGRANGIDEHAYMIRFTPRKPTSIWSAVNIAKVAELTQQGRMRPAGLAAFARRREDRSKVYAHERTEPAELEPAQEARLRADVAAWEFFTTQPPWYRRAATHWVVSAKREATKDKRLATLIEDSAAGRTLAHLTRPRGPAPRAAPTSAPARTRSRPR